MTMVAMASTILFGLIAVSPGLAQVPSESFQGLIVVVAMLKFVAAGLLIWSIGLLSRRNHEKYVASLGCFFGLLSVQKTSAWPVPGPYTALIQFALAVVFGIIQIRILQSVIRRAEDSLEKGAL